MEWTTTAPTPTTVFEILDNGTSHYAPKSGETTLLQAMIDYDDQSSETLQRTVQIREIALGFTSAWESATLPIPEEPEWMQSWPSTELLPRFHVTDNGASYTAVNPGLTLQEGAEHYGSAFVPGTEAYVCENREPHEVQIREVSTFGGQGPWETFTVPVGA